MSLTENLNEKLIKKIIIRNEKKRNIKQNQKEIRDKM